MLSPTYLLATLATVAQLLLPSKLQHKPPPDAAARTLIVPLDGLFNARAASHAPLAPGERGFDGRGGSYPATEGCLPTGRWVDQGVEFKLPGAWGDAQGDHVLSYGQAIALRQPVEVTALHILVAGDFYDGNSQESMTVQYEDGSERNVSFAVVDWWSIHWLNKASIKCLYHFTTSGPNWNVTHIHHVVIPLPSLSPRHSSAKVAALYLPHGRETGQNRLHVFALSLALPDLSSTATKPALFIRHARATSRWSALPDGRKAQSVVPVLENRASSELVRDERAWLRGGLEVRLEGLPEGWEVVQDGIVGRLMPGDERQVEMLVAPTVGQATSKEGWNGTVWLQGVHVDKQTVDLGRARLEGRLVNDWTTIWKDPEVDLEFHDSPQWFDDAKFGIFVHWGLFSVPAWTDRGRYAEWYWYWLHEDAADKSSTWQHRLDTYGKDFKYDDFIPSFTGAKFEADEWIKLIADAGAKYFVLTTKHHDGFALFDTRRTTNRSSVVLAPGKRDYVRELFDAANRQGELKKGTYFSMPEWYNPDYAPYGWERFPGGSPPDVYNPGAHEPYTGWTHQRDYVEDLQLEQMRILTEMGTDLLWCDIGGANHSSALLPDWYSSTAVEGRQVTTNNRCGVAPDFDTPEYERFTTVQRRKWETCEGIDPFSFGYNRNTKEADYRSGKELIQNLIDITSKNGNYLLNVGPTGEGEIIEVMQTRLREVGRWLAVHGEAIYETVPFPLLPELIDAGCGLNLRFTRTNTAFYIHSLNPPSTPSFHIPVSLPVLKRDRISLLTAAGGVALEWKLSEDGGLVISLPENALALGEAVYVFRVEQAWGK